ncbi:MAG TPA: hypothetical protein PLF92_06145 [Arenimonas sp.]|nr:hypothetical protein [Arenimonas sp.]
MVDGAGIDVKTPLDEPAFAFDRAMKSLMMTQLMAVLFLEFNISSAGALVNSKVDSVRTTAHLPAAMTLLETPRTESETDSSRNLCFESILHTLNIHSREHRRPGINSQQKRSPAKAGLRSA